MAKIGVNGKWDTSCGKFFMMHKPKRSFFNNDQFFFVVCKQELTGANVLSSQTFLSEIFKASAILSSESCLATELRDRISFPTEMFFFLICLCCGRENSNCMVQILMCPFPDCMIFFFRELLSNWTKKEGVLSPESCTEEWSTDKVCVFLKSTANCSKAVNNAFKPNQSNSCYHCR